MSKTEKLRNKIILRLFYETGIRTSEIINLKIYDFDLEKERFIIRELSSNLIRYGFISKRTNSLIQEYTYYRDDDDYLLKCANQNRKMSRTGIENVLRDFNRTMGIDSHISELRLRKNFIKRFMKATNDIQALFQIIGTSYIEGSNKYSVDELQRIYSEADMSLKE